ncbi:putative sh3 domain-containing protein [Phaeoacremonium minimum UCRPA7]|uniref:Putative sh3 domain-containing protein n=1 Tax=Phaeoacremonium minimum (strain UCR-PA7) TaxID=1286976 RepID=R8BWJ6_PHAM7|nr:putative sh3 domain-containing protein [Phaeoacremonium minimum UCRPA7]EOO03717.1 putative sh3 domain-containing protein [Phaeoacremonium minimum UCRPA7]
MASECKKCGKILTSFVDPRQAFGPDKVIPPSVLASARGLAILTVIKAGFLGSARFGSGLVVARLPDGSWSAPSAIATAGAGFGGQIGFELTDFVFILNDANAVKTFSQAGSLTLGGNVSIAAGPVGRNAEAAGAASLKSVAGIFSYSKTKGLFAGVSLEGSAIVERKDANAKLYGRQVSARELLTGSERPPPQAGPLMSILNSRVFAGARQGSFDDGMYNDIPVYSDQHDDVVWNGQRGNAYGEGQTRSSMYGGSQDRGFNDNGYGGPKRATTWQDDVYDQPRGFGSRSNTFQDVTVPREYQQPEEKKAGPGRPAAPKPNFASKQALLKKNEAVALFTFEADQPGDLGFKKGDIITVLKKTDSENDWWTGMIGTKHGIFPSNYVKLKE